MLVADPQLVDPHTYPGRPWPLSTLTVGITDNYLRRSFDQLQWQLGPDSVFFLGDLFDGGREWKTAHGSFEDPEWGARPESEREHAKTWRKKYGQSFWLEEYARFGDIFLNPWLKWGATSGAAHKRRKFAALPGNHDLGFGAEIKLSVRNRFETYFGEGNRVDVIGNHTFVSVDTVSMSAASSAEAGRHDLKPIYQPTLDFLNAVGREKQKAVERELRFLRGEVPHGQFKHRIQELDKAKFDDEPAASGSKAPELPTVLLSHVPLYRPPGTPCGPLRERWPPTKPPKGQTEPVFPDERNAISVSRGYQYQNVLGEKDSEELIRKVGNVVHAFSGDDHDYCAVTHSDAQANVPEITVKSISMAMGVSKPGVLLVSLYNPINPADGTPLLPANQPTLQTHLCLLPNQIATYLRYASLALLSLVLLTARAVLVPFLGLQPFALDPADRPPRLAVGGGGGGGGGLLPVFKAKVEDYDGYALPYHNQHRSFSASSSHVLSSRSAANGAVPVAAAATTTRERSGSGPVAAAANGLSAQARNASPHKGSRDARGRRKNRGKSAWDGAGGIGRSRRGPRIEIPSEDTEDEEMGYYGYGYGYGSGHDGGKGRWKAAAWRRGRRRRPGSVVGVVVREWWTSVWRVTWMALLVFCWLSWKG